MGKQNAIGKAHEQLTRDLLNGVEPQSDTLEKLEQLDEDQQKRVEIGAQKASEFIRNDVQFEITDAKEVGDRLKTTEESTDIIVRGDDEERGYSLKMTSSGSSNVRNRTLNTLCENLLGKSESEVFSEEQKQNYQSLLQEYADRSGVKSKEPSEYVRSVVVERLQELKNKEEKLLRERLVNEMYLDATHVGCYIEKDGTFRYLYNFETEENVKLRRGAGELTIETRETDSSNILFKIDGEEAFKIAIYGQSDSSGRRASLRTAMRVQTNKI